MLDKPTLTDNGNGTVNISSQDVSMYKTNDWRDGLDKYTIPIANNLTLVDNATNYIIVSYNSGTPVYQSITDVSTINESDIIPVYTIYRDGTILHILDWDSLGRGMVNRLNARFVKTRRFERQDGLIVSEFGTRNLNISAGTVWYGANNISITDVSSTINTFTLYSHTAGSWGAAIQTQWNNSQYDDGTDLQSLTVAEYGVIWIYYHMDI